MPGRRVIEVSAVDALAYELSQHLLKMLELGRAVCQAEANGVPPAKVEDPLGYLTLGEIAGLFNKSTKAFTSLEQRDPDIRALRARAPSGPDKKRQPRLYSKRRTHEYLKKI